MGTFQEYKKAYPANQKPVCETLLIFSHGLPNRMRVANGSSFLSQLFYPAEPTSSLAYSGDWKG